MNEILSLFKAEFEEYLVAKLSYIDGAEQPIADGIRYALDGGKRLRPILVMLGADFMGKAYNSNMEIALGLECIHNYSLVHDDLPCMDNDDMRHGKNATHKQFGEGMGVLIGDALLNMAYEVMLNVDNKTINYYLAINYIARMAGILGMVGGQCIDIKEQAMRDNTLEEVLELNSLKTACLFKASLVGSCIACGATAEEVSDLEHFTDKIGLIFQMVDDVLDVTSTVTELGKNINSDKESNKITYLSLVGIDKTKRDILKLEKDAVLLLNKYGARADKLIKLCNYLTNRTH